MLQAPTNPPADLMDVLTSPGALALEFIGMLVIFYFMYKFIRKQMAESPKFTLPKTGGASRPPVQQPDPWTEAERRNAERLAEEARRRQAAKDRETRDQ